MRLDRSELEREVASIFLTSWIDEESLAAVGPEILYEARKCTNWRTLRDNDPARYWLQGMKRKDLDRLFDEMSGRDGQLISEQAFRQRYLEKRACSTGETQKTLGLAANPLQDFTLATSGGADQRAHLQLAECVNDAAANIVNIFSRKSRHLRALRVNSPSGAGDDRAGRMLLAGGHDLLLNRLTWLYR